MKHINIVIIDGVERDMATLSAEEREKIVNELNRVAVGYLGYPEEVSRIVRNFSDFIVGRLKDLKEKTA